MHQETQFDFYQRNELEGCEVVTTAVIDDYLDFNYEIEIRPAFDHLALFTSVEAARLGHDYFKTDDWTAEVNFWKHSGSL